MAGAAGMVAQAAMAVPAGGSPEPAEQSKNRSARHPASAVQSLQKIEVSP